MRTMSVARNYRIELRNVSLTLQGRKVINDLNIDIRERRVGIIGRNGSGKSTLARLMSGLVTPTGGTVRLNGVDPARDRKMAIRSIGIVFQNPDHQIIFPTVLEEIAFGPMNIGIGKTDAEVAAMDLLDRFGCQDLSGRHVHSLSQGQRHLVCLLSVIVMNPDVLILDEPFTGPDKPTVTKLFRMLEGLSQSVLLITHDTDKLTGFDRAIWLDQGHLYRDGRPGAVLGEFDDMMKRLGESDAVADLP